jgi:hypothetical protein
VYIIRALDERACLQPGKTGLGFGVGREALVAYFARRGCQILATDLATPEAARLGWVQSNHAISRVSRDKSASAAWI